MYLPHFIVMLVHAKGLQAQENESTLELVYVSASVRGEIKDKPTKTVIDLALALTFTAMNIIVSSGLSSISKHVGFLSWIALVFVTGIFLVRALGNVLAISDKATRLFLRFLGILEKWSRKRSSKDAIYIIAITLTAVAFRPFWERMGGAGNALPTITTYIVLVLVLLFVYDTGRTLCRISDEKAGVVANWFCQRNNKEISK